MFLGNEDGNLSSAWPRRDRTAQGHGAKEPEKRPQLRRHVPNANPTRAVTGTSQEHANFGGLELGKRMQIIVVLQ